MDDYSASMSLEDQLLAPLTVETAQESEQPETEPEVGLFISDLDKQTSFLEGTKAAVADREALEAMLGEPYHVLPGDRFLLCGRHYLVVDHIIDPPHLWKELLVENRVFLPWPDVLAADVFHHTAPASVMVQPDRYIAGTILNYYLARHGQEAVVKVR